MATLSFISLAVSVLGSIFYVLVFENIEFIPFFVVAAILSVLLPPIAKKIRIHKRKKGKVAEIVAIILGGFNFYCIIFVHTKLPVFIGYLGWVVCVLFYRSIREAEVETSENNSDGFKSEEVIIANPATDKQPQDDILFSETTIDTSKSIENEEHALSSNTVTYKQKSRGLKILIGSLISLVVIAIISAIIILYVPTKIYVPPKIIEQDIDTIYGCPEFFKIEFGMSVKEASALIAVKHKSNTGFESAFDSRNSLIFLEEDTKFDLYGIPVKDVLCGFDVLKLDSVIIVFSKDNASLNTIIDLYKKIYGEPSNNHEYSATWEGTRTTIDVYDSALLDIDKDEIIVRYFINPNSQFTALSFNGTEIDPCGFLSKNYIFDKKPSYYISGLEEGEDYIFKEYSTEGFGSFSHYTLYPYFEYMGIEAGNTAIDFSVDGMETTVGTVSYLFILDSTNVANRINYIYSKLTNLYGVYERCDYTSMYYSDLGIVDLSYDEWKSQILIGMQGIYNIQWNYSGRLITLGLTIKPDASYFEGRVAFSS